MRYLLILCFSLLAGCASVFDTTFTPEYDRGPNVKIEYVYVDTQDEMIQWCGMGYDGKKQILGCAKTGPSDDFPCYVVTYRTPIPGVKEHEEKHCRYGRWHI